MKKLFLLLLLFSILLSLVGCGARVAGNPKGHNYQRYQELSDTPAEEL